jgi:hypothetical protein
MESIRCRSESNFVVILREEQPKDLAPDFQSGILRFAQNDRQKLVVHEEKRLKDPVLALQGETLHIVQGDKRNTNKGPIT